MHFVIWSGRIQKKWILGQLAPEVLDGSLVNLWPMISCILTTWSSSAGLINSCTKVCYCSPITYLKRTRPNFSLFHRVQIHVRRSTSDSMECSQLLLSLRQCGFHFGIHWCRQPDSKAIRCCARQWTSHTDQGSNSVFPMKRKSNIAKRTIGIISWP